jgi:hypothetical protein
MRGFGVREVFALLAVGVVAFISLQFLDPAAGQGGDGPPPPVSRGLRPPEPTPTPAPTPTPLPAPMELARPERFRVEFFDDRRTSGHVKVGDGAVEGLALEFEGPPFPDLVDDRWSLVASVPVELPAAGRYRFVLSYRGELVVWVDGEEVARAAGPSEAGVLEVVFAHEGGPAELAIELRDRGGVARLRWE